ncbi:hypothetical protein P8452_35977 [Trifolium repens]|nr:hypothetical protein P8452_35977 [Trifolium repens]
MAGTATATATTCTGTSAARWKQPLLPPPFRRRQHQRQPVIVSFKNNNNKPNDMDRVLKEAWQNANDNFERFLFEAKKTAQRIDRQYSVSQRLSSAASAASARAREIDRDFQIGIKYRNFTSDFALNWPKYRVQISKFLDSPVGKSFTTIFFIWFAFSGWLFRFLIIATWVLPFAGPLLIGTLANNLVIKGACPNCKTQFAGYKNQVVRCTSCGNIVWQPKDKGDFFTRGGKNKSASKSDPNIIDVDFEEK